MKLNRLLLTVLCAVMSIGAWADTDKLTTENGWQKLTVLPDNLADYYFVFVDNDLDYMLSYEEGVNQSNVATYKTMVYRTSKDAAMNPAMLWELALIETGKYSIKCAVEPTYFIQTENNDYRYCHTHDNGNGDTQWYKWGIAYSDGTWKIQNPQDATNYIGPWANNGVAANGLNVAGNCINETGTDQVIGKFQIYAILKSKVSWTGNASTDNPANMTYKIQNATAAFNGTTGWTGTSQTDNLDYKRNAGNGFDGFPGIHESSNWGASNYSQTITQQITDLPNGLYKVRAAVMGAVGATIKVNIGGPDYTFPVNGDTGGSIDKDGNTVEQGTGQRGFNWGETELYNVTNNSLTITFTTSATTIHQWANIDNVELYYCGPIEGSDLTSFITNPKFSGNADGWTLTPGGSDKIVRWWGGGNTDLDADGQSGDGYGMLSFGTHESDTREASASQTVTNLPKGYYILGFKYKSGMEGETAIVKANNASISVATYDTQQVWIESSMPCLVTEDGNLNINLSANFTDAYKHINFDNFTLTYIGSQPSSEMDFTSFVANPSFEDDFSGWTNSNDYLKIKSDDSFDGKQGSKYAAVESISTTFSLSQGVADLPAGYYVVSANANKTGSYGREPALKAGGNSVNIVNISDNYSVAAQLQNAGPLPISFEGKANAGAWAGLDDFKVVYYKELPEVTAVTGAMNETIAATLSTAKETYDAAKTAANYNAFQNANMAAKVSIGIYEQISAAIDAQVEADEAKLNLLSQEVKDAYNARIKEIRNTRTYNTLAEAQAELASAFAYALNSQDGGVDMTALITNADCSSATGWEGSPDVKNNENFEKYNTTFDIYQNIENLPAGWYKLTVQGFDRQTDNANTYGKASALKRAYLYAGEAKAFLMGIFDDASDTQLNGGTNEVSSNDKYMPNMPAAAAKYFEAGKYNNEVMVYHNAGTLRIGVKKEYQSGKDWTLMDNFTLSYMGDELEDNTQFTQYICNPSFESYDFTGWTKAGNITCVNNNDNITGKDGSVYVESYYKADAAASSEDGGVEQTLQNMPTGLYKLTVRSNGRNQTEPHVFANEDKTMFDGVGDYDVYTNVTDGNLTLGAKFTADKSTDKDHWFALDNFRLTYLGENPTYELATGIMNAEVAQAQTNAETTFNNNKTGANFMALLAAIDNAKASIANYEKVVAYNTKAEALDTDGQAAYAPTLAAYNNGTLTKDGEEAQAKEAYIKAVKSQTSIDSDWTDVLVNPHFYENNTNGWNMNGKASPKEVSSAYHNCEYYQQTFNMSMTITGMKKGTYEISMQAFQRPGAANADLLNKEESGEWTSMAELYTTAERTPVTHIAKEKSTTRIAGDDSEIDISGTKYYIPNSMSGARTWFDTEYADGVPHYVTTAHAVVTEDGGDLSFGFQGELKTSCWLIFDNFTLKYVNTDIFVDPTESEKLIAQAQIILYGTPFDATLKANLTTAKTNLEADKTSGEYYKTLLDAVNAASASVDLYKKAKAALDMINAEVVNTNVYNATVLATMNDNYNNGTFASEAEITKMAGTGSGGNIRYENAAAQVLLSGWMVGETEATTIGSGFYINDWSKEAEGKQNGSGMIVPFFEYWIADENSLAAKTFTRTVTGLDNGYYKVDILTRFRIKNNGGNVAKGITLAVNDNKTAQAYSEIGGTCDDGSQFRYAILTATAEVTDGNLVIKYDVADGNNLSWLSFKNANYTKIDEAAYDIACAKSTLCEKVKDIDDVPTTNIGTNAFQYPTAEINTINETIAAAKTLYANAEATLDAVKGQTATVAALSIPALNAPAENARYTITNVSASFNAQNKAMTYIAGERNDMGGYNIRYLIAPNANYAQAFKFTAAGETNTYYLSQIDVDGNERYMSTGKAYSGGNDNQIRTTTDLDKAAKFRVTPMAEEGNWYLWNVAANNYLSSNSGNGDNGVYTSGSYYRMVIAEATEATANLKITAAQWGTFMAPFDIDIAENNLTEMRMYQCTGVEGDALVLEREKYVMHANTPYLVYSETEYNTNHSGWGMATKDEYTVGCFTGAYKTTNVPEGSYILLKQNDKLGFYVVAAHNTYTNVPTVGANRAYLTVPAALSASAFYFSINDDEQETAVSAVEALTTGEAEIYDLKGMRQQTLQPGINIVRQPNGKTQKVLVK